MELDALRGLMLVIMACTHLPTRLRSYSDQPLGFVSAAEGFVFLSAFVVGETCSSLLAQRGVACLRQRLWSRALRVYVYHLVLLAFAFTIVATLAAATGRPGVRNLLAFYFEAPGVALLSGPLLLYQPPLLDILPIYVVFLALSPFVLERVQRRGWYGVAVCSILLWGFAQLGARQWLHHQVCALLGLHVPVEAAGSFDLLAWQALWHAGLWAGSRDGAARRYVPAPLFTSAATLAVGFFAWRHQLGGVSIELGGGYGWLDKWHLGALRLLNFAALALVVSHGVLPLLRRLGASVLSLLGRASLQAFAAHLLLCLLSLGLVVDDDTPLSSGEELVVLAFTFGAMLLVAWRTSLRVQRPPLAR